MHGIFINHYPKRYDVFVLCKRYLNFGDFVSAFNRNPTCDVFKCHILIRLLKSKTRESEICESHFWLNNDKNHHLGASLFEPILESAKIT